MTRPLAVATRRSMLLAGLLVSTPLAVLAHTHTPPTQPPCTADGCCQPSHPWGYVKPNWRPWPGGAAGTFQPQSQPGPSDRDPLSPYVKPDPTVEDQEAPPTVEALEPADTTPAAESDVELPSLPEFETPTPEAAPNGAPAGAPAAAPAAPGGQLFDMPPSVPFSTPATPPATQPAPATPAPFQFNMRAPRPQLEQNAPPSLPMTLQTNVAPANGASPRRLPMIPAAGGVMPASASVELNDAPPAMPAVFFGK